MKSAAPVDQVALEQQMVKLHEAAQSRPSQQGRRNGIWQTSTLSIICRIRRTDQLAAIVTMDHDDSEC